MMKRLLLLTATILLSAGLATAQKQTTTPKTAAPTVTTAKTNVTKPPKAPKVAKTMPTDDAGIKACIDGKLAKSKMASEFQDSVSGGTATFTGSTKVPGHKGGVSGIGKSCGAKSIVNNITIEGKPAKAEKLKTPKTPKPASSPKTPTSSH